MAAALAAHLVLALSAVLRTTNCRPTGAHEWGAVMLRNFRHLCVLVACGLSLGLAVGPAAGQERRPTPASVPVALDQDHRLWQQVLSAAVSFPHGVDYAGLSAQRETLDQYRAQLAQAQLPEGRPGQLAFWINAYNALTVDLVLHLLPDPGDNAAAAWKDFSVLTSVEGFWTNYAYEVAGEWLTIDAIQKVKLAALKEPRIHFAINCASVSCPPLLDQAFTGERLEQQLDRVTRAFVADTAQVQVESTGWTGRGRRATLNPLMQWYRDDFGGSDDGVRKFLVRHASPERAADLSRAELAYGAYDWKLNFFPKPR
ncbi:MAG: DUF547 domain-containing protein [Planctomycetota bacterium]|nr:MAG: DUF547 domain-containing protein [Planctomycetota bacterium]